MAHHRGEDRFQAALFPVMLDELVEADAMVRVIDAWVGSLDLIGLDFANAQAQCMGRPPYDPADLLKLYICGYLNGVRSSRALERECLRNVEVMWLLGRMAPDYKTIADFRRRNEHALVAVSAAFVQFARRQGLVKGALVAIDGSKIRAVASPKAVGRVADLERERTALAHEVENYLRQLDAADSYSSEGPKRGAIEKALVRLQKRQTEIDGEATRMANSRSSLSVQTEPQARSMRGLHGAPGYNLQTAVDGDSHLIVHHEVCNDTSDVGQLAPMACAAAQVLEASPVVVADAGYANGEHLQALDEAGLTAYVASNRAVNGQGDGTLYDRTAFTYDADKDCYTCPAGQILARKQVLNKEKCVVYAAQESACGQCALKSQCTESKRRFVSRHFNEDVLDANAKRVAASPEMMAVRRQTVEHPFGTIKSQILKNARLLVRGLSGARSELSLAVLAYNLKRMANMKGNAWALQVLAA